jgi:periplasmic protein TonB
MKTLETLKTMTMAGALGLALMLTSSTFANNAPIVDNPTSFGEDQIDLDEYIAQNVKYPESLLESGYEVIVNITFWIDKFGNVLNAEVIKTTPVGSKKDMMSIHDLSLFETAALNAVRDMPKWDPAVINGKSLPRQYKLPIFFKEA